MKRVISTILLSFLAFLFVFCEDIYAKDKDVSITGTVYEFTDKNSDYEFSTSKSSTSISGRFNLKGDVKDNGKTGNFLNYDVKDGTVSFFYNINKDLITEDIDKLHIIEDKSKKVDTIKLEEKINSGVLILQTSLGGEKWITDTILYDVFKDENSLKDAIYETNNYQLVNGCYYRIIVAYETSIRTEDKKIGPDKYDYKKNVEVYQFFIQDKSSQSESKTLEQTKNKNKRIGDLNKVKTDDGYALAHKELLEQGDPHFSKSIGDFYINGYTSEEFKDGDLVLLKKPGDKITLWFELTENIDCLFGNEKLSIAYDTDNNDTNFNYEGNEFKRGCLIIKQENKQGGKRIIPYTDFLSACSTATANTKVNLFEEGDYEVALNYEINKDEIIDKRTSYRISFKFKIRNANAMAYPRDIVSKSELSDNSFTPNGFWIDYANSQYINVYVKQFALKNSAGGRKMDLRYDGSTNDEQKFSDPGIYTFIVKNEYTSLETTKTIYVGDDPFIKALAVTGLTIKELENELNNGAEILDNGTLQYPEPEVIEIVEEETNELDEESEDALNDNQAQEENSTKESEESKQVEVNDDTQKSSNVEKAVPAEDISSDEKAESDDLSVTENVKKSTNIMPWIIIGVLVVVIIFLAKKKNKDKD